MSLVADWIVQVAALVSAAAATGAFGLGVAAVIMLRRHDRVLFGEDVVGHDDGLVGQVRDHRTALEEEELL